MFDWHIEKQGGGAGQRQARHHLWEVREGTHPGA